MKTSLLEKLLEFYRDEPEDPFNLYSLALEYQKYDTSQSKRCFEQLLDKFPNYLPTYYVAAQFFALIDRDIRPEIIYLKGIQIALEQQNYKTHQELVRAYRAFLDEEIEEE